MELIDRITARKEMLLETTQSDHNAMYGLIKQTVV